MEVGSRSGQPLLTPHPRMILETIKRPNVGIKIRLADLKLVPFNPPCPEEHFRIKFSYNIFLYQPVIAFLGQNRAKNGGMTSKSLADRGIKGPKWLQTY